MNTEPTLLFGVGATKAGTSWLYDYLAGHGGAHLRSIKELHYFDTLESGAFKRQISVHDRYAARLRGRMLAVEGDALARTTAKMRDVLDWQAVLRLETEENGRYLSYLTDGAEGKSVVGDITPSYALLPVSRLRAMAGMMADTRFVYLMRDPVSRLWSHVRMIGKRAAATADAVPEACFAALEQVLNGAQSGMTERGDYSGALQRLWQAVDPTKLLVMFMEDMLTPAGLARLCKFLGIDYVEAAFDRPVHVGPALAMTPEHTARARALLRPQYEFVARHYPDIPANWRKNMGEGL